MPLRDLDKPVLFLAFANERLEKNRYLLGLVEEQRALQDILGNIEDFELVLRVNARLSDIFEVFQSPRYRDRIVVFHFAGHAGSEELLFEGALGSQSAQASGLASFLGKQSGLHFVFLNGCATGGHTRLLLDSGVPTVLATNSNVSDRLAVEFSRLFYQGLSGGLELSRAYEEADAGTAAFRQSEDITRDVKRVSMSSDSVRQWHLAGEEVALSWHLALQLSDPLYGVPKAPEPEEYPASPFRYLNYFQRDDASLFFGRGREIGELYRRITRPGRFVQLVYGCSGVGKSSLFCAGLLPRLEDDFTPVYLRRKPEEGLMGTLRSGLSKSGGRGMSLWELWESFERTPIVVLDQVEEVFVGQNQLSAEEELMELVEGVDELKSKSSRGRLILSFRKEWFPELFSQIRTLNPSPPYLIEPLDKAGIIEAVVGPTTLSPYQHVKVSQDLPDQLVTLLTFSSQVSIAPRLQIALSKMWSLANSPEYGNPESPSFDLNLLRKVSEEGLGLAEFLKGQLKKIEDDGHTRQAAQKGLVLDVLEYHTTPEGTRKERTQEELERDYEGNAFPLSELLLVLRSKYLIFEVDGKGSTSLAHDTLAPYVRRAYLESLRPAQMSRKYLDSVGVTRNHLGAKIVSIFWAKRWMRWSKEDQIVWLSEARRWVLQISCGLLLFFLLGVWGNGRLARERGLGKLNGLVGEVHQELESGEQLNALKHALSAGRLIQELGAENYPELEMDVLLALSSSIFSTQERAQVISELECSVGLGPRNAVSLVVDDELYVDGQRLLSDFGRIIEQKWTLSGEHFLLTEQPFEDGSGSVFIWKKRTSSGLAAVSSEEGYWLTNSSAELDTVYESGLFRAGYGQGEKLEDLKVWGGLGWQQFKLSIESIPASVRHWNLIGICRDFGVVAQDPDSSAVLFLNLNTDADGSAWFDEKAQSLITLPGEDIESIEFQPSTGTSMAVGSSGTVLFGEEFLLDTKRNLRDLEVAPDNSDFFALEGTRDVSLWKYSGMPHRSRCVKSTVSAVVFSSRDEAFLKAWNQEREEYDWLLFSYERGFGEKLCSGGDLVPLDENTVLWRSDGREFLVFERDSGLWEESSRIVGTEDRELLNRETYMINSSLESGEGSRKLLYEGRSFGVLGPGGEDRSSVRFLPPWCLLSWTSVSPDGQRIVFGYDDLLAGGSWITWIDFDLEILIGQAESELELDRELRFLTRPKN